MAVGDAFLDKEARDEMPCRNCSGVRENSGLSARGFLAWKGARFLSLLRRIESHITKLIKNPRVCSMRGVDPYGRPIA